MHLLEAPWLLAGGGAVVDGNGIALRSKAVMTRSRKSVAKVKRFSFKWCVVDAGHQVIQM